MFSFRPKIEQIRQEMLDPHFIENEKDDNILGKSKNGQISPKNFPLDFDSFTFEFKDSLFFKTFKKKNMTHTNCEITFDNSEFFSTKKTDEMVEYLIKFSKNFPEINQQVIFDEDLNGICSQKIHLYFSKVFDVYLQKSYKLSSKTLENNQKEIVFSFFQPIEELKAKLIDNVLNNFRHK